MADRSQAPSSTPPKSGARPGVLGSAYYKLFSASTISNLGDGIGGIAYPWLASAVTRDPILVALVVAVQRLPWLVFSLPAGVITDRYERRTLMVIANAARAVLTMGVALMVLREQGTLPSPAELEDASLIVSTNVGLYVVILMATLLLGTAEVLPRQSFPRSSIVISSKRPTADCGALRPS